MKNALKIFGVLLLSVFVFAACSKDASPADSDVFVGTYNGSVGYTGSKTVANDDGRVTIVKIGSTYNFDFSDGIPSLTGVKFEKKDDNTYVSIGSGLTGITVTANRLTMLVTKDGNTWRANCTR